MLKKHPFWPFLFHPWKAAQAVERRREAKRRVLAAQEEAVQLRKRIHEMYAYTNLKRTDDHQTILYQSLERDLVDLLRDVTHWAGVARQPIAA